MPTEPVIDADAHIGLVRAGLLLDPSGAAADELEASLDAAEADWLERLLALSDAQVAALAEAGANLPRRAEAPMTDAERHARLDEGFAAELRALDAQAARIAGRRRALLAEHLRRASRRGGDATMQVRELATIAAAELRVSDVAMERAMTEAVAIVEELPLAHAAACEGRLSASHLRVLDAETLPLRLDAAVAPELRARVEAELVAIAERTTPARLRRRAGRIVDAALSAPLQQRYDAAREERHVRLHELPDGMCEVAARMPALLGAAILDRLTQAVRALPADDPRTIDQRRADALAELLLCGQAPDDAHAASAITPVVTVTIPATALLADDGAADPDPASLHGRMLVDPATARAIAAGASGWDRLFLSPVTGRALAVDRYRPSAAQRRWLRARDGRCRFPGCGAPALRADADHTREHAHGGPTADGNLAHLCRRHHTIKHATRWHVRQLSGGVLEWTSPTGTILTDEPEPPPRPRIPSFHDPRPARARGPPGRPHPF
ncbi:HNH endonuclease signature motif containing protein [Agrococcus terreus]|uniref:HNH nuclease domain-containing protein n=1 Tax=Agrococcus terreus TaxID=574649 RepID=A0ABQ2KI74_9MICO|nr:HNH endonuclease signature motif containing protein [Agrococcus terreus]GGN84113.1 hypothetical protein GCM10010968_15620 [Agrococcus terreus]